MRQSSLALFVGLELAVAAMAQAAPKSAKNGASGHGKLQRRSIIDAQPSRTEDSIKLAGGGGATLHNLNPDVNVAYLLSVRWPGQSERHYHLENADPARHRLRLDAAQPTALIVDDQTAKKPCELLKSAEKLAGAARGGPFVALCDDAVVLRSPGASKSWYGSLRGKWGGAEVATFTKGKYQRSSGGSGDARPAAAKVRADKMLAAHNLGIAVAAEADGRLASGRWYPSKAQDSIHVSVIEPGQVAADILASHPSLVSKLDSVEAKAMAHLVAFDLNDLELGFGMGTDHPKVAWSPRIPAKMRDSSVGGPDGYADWKPLVEPGMIHPRLASQVVATFTGGFKRQHGAMKVGPTAFVNHGTHYGFVENGVIFSSLVPGLATLYTTKDGATEMRNWTDADQSVAPTLRHARQNGMALIEADDKSGKPVPGKLVNQWLPGNWGGSAAIELRTMRAGACIQENGGRRFLLYAWFPTATPSAMARVFQAYGCTFAMHLDMNAPVHTYLAVFGQDGSKRAAEHIAKSMAGEDPTAGGQTLPRFLAASDDRDFFYVTRKKK